MRVPWGPRRLHALHSGRRWKRCRMTQNCDALTLRSAFERYYVPQHPGATPGSMKTTRYRIGLWERTTPNSYLRSLTRADFDNLRPQLVDAGYAAASIESLISVVRSICEACVEEGLMSHSPR